MWSLSLRLVLCDLGWDPQSSQALVPFTCQWWITWDLDERSCMLMFWTVKCPVSNLSYWTNSIMVSWNLLEIQFLGTLHSYWLKICILTDWKSAFWQDAQVVSGRLASEKPCIRWWHSCSQKASVNHTSWIGVWSRCHISLFIEFSLILSSHSPGLKWRFCIYS